MPKVCFNETKNINVNPWPLKWSMTTFGRKKNKIITCFFPPPDSYKLNKAHKYISSEQHLQLSELGK